MMPSNPSFAAGKSKKFVKKLLRQITEEHKKRKGPTIEGPKTI
jgi:hypothetical protein